MNALLGNKDNFIIDPKTEEPWEYTKIPRSCFPNRPDPLVVNKHDSAAQNFWEPLRQEILEQRRSQAITNGTSPSVYPRCYNESLLVLILNRLGEPTRKQMMEKYRAQGGQVILDCYMFQVNRNSTNSCKVFKCK
jgi:hypothetical protein